MKILIVDDEPKIAHTLVDILRGEGHDAISVSNGTSALEWAVKIVPDVVLSDVIMPGINGIEAAKEIMRCLPNCRIILFSGQASSMDILEQARSEGYAFDLLAKPVNPEVLLSAINGEGGEGPTPETS
jgi:DNA-binding NtrC family response regulator